MWAGSRSSRTWMRTWTRPGRAGAGRSSWSARPASARPRSSTTPGASGGDGDPRRAWRRGRGGAALCRPGGGARAPPGGPRSPAAAAARRAGRRAGTRRPRPQTAASRPTRVRWPCSRTPPSGRRWPCSSTTPTGSTAPRWRRSCSARGASRVSASRSCSRFARASARRSTRRGCPSRLAGLEPAAAAALVRREAETRVASAVVTRLHEATGGNPLALLELARSSSRRPSSQGPSRCRRCSRWAPTLNARSARGSRGCPRTRRAALLIAAASDSAGRRRDHRRAPARSLTLSALAPAEIGDVVTIAGGAVEFTHPLLRSAAYLGPTPPVRRDAHAALAALPSPDADRVRRAWHLALATVEPDEATAAEARGRRQGGARPRRTRGRGPGVRRGGTPDPRGKERVRRLIETATEHHLAGLTGSRPAAARRRARRRAGPHHARGRAAAASPRPHTGQSRAAMRDLLIAEATRVEPHDPARASAMLLDASPPRSCSVSPRGAAACRAGLSAGPRARRHLRLIAAFVLGGRGSWRATPLRANRCSARPPARGLA